MRAVSEQPALQSIDAVLCRVAEQALPLGPFEPKNAVEEKERFSSDIKYNPQFQYEAQDRDGLERSLAEVERLEFSPYGVGLFFHQAKTYLAARLLLRLSLGQNEIWEVPLYQPPPPHVINLARRLLTAPAAPAPVVIRSFGADEQERLIRTRLAEYGFTDWKVIVRPNISAMNTDPANRIVNIRADSRYTIEELKRNVVHEVDTHVLRAVNGDHQDHRIFAVGAIPSYMTTEEGLAVINEERMRYVDAERTRMFAARVVASARALQAGFAEVYAELRDYRFSHDEAWVITKRVKRGLGDTACSGGYVKDHVYLWGRLLVEEFVLGGGDLKNLYVGKIAIEHIPLFGQLGLRPAKILPLPYL